MQESIVFQNVGNKQLEIEVLKMPCTIISKIIKHSGIDITKYVQERYTKNYKTLLREIEDLNK